MQFFLGVNDNVTASVLFGCDGSACLSFHYLVDRKFVVFDQAIEAFMKTRSSANEPGKDEEWD